MNEREKELEKEINLDKSHFFDKADMYFRKSIFSARLDELRRRNKEIKEIIGEAVKKIIDRIDVENGKDRDRIKKQDVLKIMIEELGEKLT